MPRRGRAPRREIEPDVKHENELVAKLINKIMQEGKKSLAERTVYSALDIMEQRMDKDPVELFEQAVDNATPILEVRPRRVGGATYQIPMEVRPARRESLAIRWLVDAARNRPGYDIEEKLAAELMDAANNTGAAVRKKEEMHRMAEANKAFAHYRW